MFPSRARLLALAVLLATSLALLAAADTAQAQPRPPGYGYSTAIEVLSVTYGGPAQQQGLERGDIILSVDGQRVRNMPEFRYRIGQSGWRAELRVWSRGNPYDEQWVTVFPRNGRIGIYGQPVYVDPWGGGYGRTRPYNP